jgi:hypothetical protein
LYDYTCFDTPSTSRYEYMSVYEEDGVWYLLLHLNQDYAPLVIAKQCGFEEFKDYVISEMKQRRLEKTYYWKAIQERPSLIERNGKLDLDYDNIVIT